VADSEKCLDPQQQFVRKAWALSGEVSDIAVHCNTIFVAGGGTIGPRTGPLAAVSARSAELLDTMPELSGEVDGVGLADPLVRALTDDGKGGWFVAGAFAFANDRRCTGLIHVLRDGRLDQTFCPRVNGPVDVLDRLGGVVYIGGSFTKVYDQPRSDVAAIRARDGAVLPWAPRFTPARYCPDREEPGGLTTGVEALAASSTGIYVGGIFSAVNGIERSSLVALDPQSGAVLPFDARLAMPTDRDCDGPRVYAVQPTEYGVAVSGVEADPRIYLDGFLRLHAAKSGDPVGPRLPRLSAEALAMVGSTLYVGGLFGAAAFDLESGSKLPWRPRVRGDVCCFVPDSGVWTIVPFRGIVYLGGNFARVGGVPHEFAAAVDARTGDPVEWDPSPNGPVLAIGRSAGSVVLGGTLAGVNVEARVGLAAIDGPTGKLLDWAPRVVGRYGPGGVNELLVHGDRLYAGGHFTKVDGLPRHSLAAFDLRSRRLADWVAAPMGGDPPYGVMALAAAEDRLYVGGDFDRLGGEPRRGAGAVDLGSGELADWNPTLHSPGSLEVHVIVAAADAVIVGGTFTEASGEAHRGVVKVDSEDGPASPWNPAPDDLGDVYALELTDAGAYLGGWFDEVGGATRSGLALVDLEDGDSTRFSAHLDGSVYELLREGERLFIAGTFAVVNGQQRAGLAAVDATTGKVLPWSPRPADRARYNPGTISLGGGALITDGYIQGNGEQVVVQPLAVS
jgi:hypothetical protein